ncbi:hypothetical protein O181_031423 [Austropuccinia psidii MF-1]|uniref:Uncharacterized protein n=1 Tax=Austropuccinia psidii MF-1 TaxID=1389203 RepID=A0A9Q3H4L0_9BASI|nr:hypothetical protein [Austropuccinia psidii MF-1]
MLSAKLTVQFLWIALFGAMHVLTNPISVKPGAFYLQELLKRTTMSAEGYSLTRRHSLQKSNYVPDATTTSPTETNLPNTSDNLNQPPNQGNSTYSPAAEENPVQVPDEKQPEGGPTSPSETSPPDSDYECDDEGDSDYSSQAQPQGNDIAPVDTTPSGPVHHPNEPTTQAPEQHQPEGNPILPPESPLDSNSDHNQPSDYTPQQHPQGTTPAPSGTSPSSPSDYSPQPTTQAPDQQRSEVPAIPPFETSLPDRGTDRNKPVNQENSGYTPQNKSQNTATTPLETSPSNPLYDSSQPTVQATEQNQPEDVPKSSSETSLPDSDYDCIEEENSDYVPHDQPQDTASAPLETSPSTSSDFSHRPSAQAPEQSQSEDRSAPPFETCVPGSYNDCNKPSRQGNTAYAP